MASSKAFSASVEWMVPQRSLPTRSHCSLVRTDASESGGVGWSSCCSSIGSPVRFSRLSSFPGFRVVLSHARICPFDRFGHGAFVVLNERQDLVAQVLTRGKIAAFEQLAPQNTEPDFHLIHPGGMSGGIIQHHPMRWIVQESCPACHR